MALEAGTRLGPYEIMSLLGKGGMGEVYRARDTRLDRDVAVKVLPAELSEDADFKRRFEREAKTISQLQHQNVCTLYDIGSEDGIDYLVMEYLEGETLEDRLRKGALPIDEVLLIGGEIADAVDAAHQHDIVHRDLKPGNVLLTKAGTKVLDFGLAKSTEMREVDADASTVLAGITREGRIVGTMPYMAPEQLKGSEADSRTDIWALGCIVYEMATGERPFGGKSQAELIASILDSEPESLARRQKLAPESLDRLVRRCLEKDPSARWSSAAEIVLELESIREKGEGRSSRLGRTLLAAAAVLLVSLTAWWMTTDRPAGSGEVETVEVAASGRRTLAVLPFENFTDDADLNQMALGIPENVIVRETEVWPVVPRDAALSVAATEPCEVASELGAGLVLGGSLQRQGSEVRVTTQLTACPERELLWSRAFDHELGGGFRLQDEIGEAIFMTLQRELWIAPGTGSGAPGDHNWHFMQRTREDNAKALDLRLEITEVAPDEPDHWFNVLLVHTQALSFGWLRMPVDPTIVEMDRLTEGCFRAEPRSWICHVMDSYTGMFSADEERALAAWEQAVERSNRQPNMLSQYGWALALFGRTEEGITAVEEARAMSPGDEWTYNFHFYLAAAHFVAEQYEEASAEVRKSISYKVRDPWAALGRAYLLLAASEAQLGRIEEAEKALALARDEVPDRTLEHIAIEWPSADSRERTLEGLRMAGMTE